MERNIYIGTAGWSYNDWQGIVYPQRRKRGFDELRYLAGIFNCVEVDTTFYRIPERHMVERWCDRVHDVKEFLFLVKMWQGFTHEHHEFIEREVEHFRECLEIIDQRDRLGCVLVQFPWSFRNLPENHYWIEQIVERFHMFTLSIEVRHSSWLNEEFLSYLRSMNIALCNIDQPSLRQNIPFTKLVTADFSYLRLHGRNAKGWFAESSDPHARYDYLYEKKDIDDLAETVKELGEKTDRTFAITNNHPGGKAAANALELKAKVSGKKVEVPGEMLSAFSHLKKIAARPVPPEGEQLEMF